MRVSAQERVDTAEFAARRERLCQAARVWAGAVAEAIKGTLPGMYEYPDRRGGAVREHADGRGARRFRPSSAEGRSRRSCTTYGPHKAEAGG